MEADSTDHFSIELQISLLDADSETYCNMDSVMDSSEEAASALTSFIEQLDYSNLVSNSEEDLGSLGPCLTFESATLTKSADLTEYVVQLHFCMQNGLRIGRDDLRRVFRHIIAQSFDGWGEDGFNVSIREKLYTVFLGSSGLVHDFAFCDPLLYDDDDSSARETLQACQKRWNEYIEVYGDPFPHFVGLRGAGSDTEPSPDVAR